MEALRFILSGDTAFYKKPDVNVETYFTYNNIHKVALTGMLGAILGLGGYSSGKKAGEDYPHFYTKLKNLKVAIIPNSKRGYFGKKIQYYNNSVGYANEDGGTLQVKEQWLENPSWTIYLYNGGIENELWDLLYQRLMHGQCTYIPYLGKNDHPAAISSLQIVTLVPGDSLYVNSLFPSELDNIDDLEYQTSSPFIFSEWAPYALDKDYNFYLLKRFVFTNCAIKQPIADMYQCDDKTLAFF